MLNIDLLPGDGVDVDEDIGDDDRDSGGAGEGASDDPAAETALPQARGQCYEGFLRRLGHASSEEPAPPSRGISGDHAAAKSQPQPLHPRR